MKYIITILILIVSLATTNHSSAQDKTWASSTISMPVSDLEQSVKWYQQLLKIEESISPAPGLSEFKINDNTWIQLFEVESITSSQNILRLEVKDIKKAHSRVAKLTESIQKIEFVEGVVYYFDFTDPDGNLFSFYQML